ncbi:uncharacterized protein LOC127266393 [Andrographis paniculata]|uniref:uncharacterized protein LOC127266393 n=1 Tax=Andrographis paniculata TaxID=175694 RepID=UPI0021E8E0D7|nr:uncharacterized protein LOC127266393 [Andrographis paniculata]
MELSPMLIFLIVSVLIGAGARPALSSKGRLNATINYNIGSSEVYEIDYRGPETHTYIPPPNRAAGDRPRIHHRRKSKLKKATRNV